MGLFWMLAKCRYNFLAQSRYGCQFKTAFLMPQSYKNYMDCDIQIIFLISPLGSLGQGVLSRLALSVHPYQQCPITIGFTGHWYEGHTSYMYRNPCPYVSLTNNIELLVLDTNTTGFYSPQYSRVLYIFGQVTLNMDPICHEWLVHEGPTRNKSPLV